MFQNWNLDTFKEGVLPFISHSWHIKLEYKQKGLKGPYFFGMGENSQESMIIPDSLKSLQKDAQVVFLAIVRKFEFFPLVSLFSEVFGLLLLYVNLFPNCSTDLKSTYKLCDFLKSIYWICGEFFDVRLMLFANLKA